MDPSRRKKYDRHIALADPGKALQRAAWQAACDGMSSLGAGLWKVGSITLSKVMEQQQRITVDRPDAIHQTPAIPTTAINTAKVANTTSPDSQH
jgi:hypothetical protein